MNNQIIKQGLVSVIIPCYNTELLLPKLLESLLQQNYKNLEIILVNDGSSDNTWEIICNYAPRLEAEGYSVKTVNQNNGGPASAVDSGLKLFTGEFLTWPDSDDWLTPDSIEKRVKIFHKYPDIDLVRCNAELVDANTKESLGHFENANKKEYVRENLFEDLLHIKTYFAPVCYMLRVSSFLKVNPSRSIYISPNAGQNIQMLLPITRLNKSIQISDVLAYYLVRKGSVSRSANNLEDIFKWELLMWEITYNTLIKISDIDNFLILKTEQYYIIKKLLPAAFRAGLHKETSDLLNKSNNNTNTKLICKIVVFLQFGRHAKILNKITFKYWSKIMARIFLYLIR